MECTASPVHLFKWTWRKFDQATYLERKRTSPKVQHLKQEVKKCPSMSVNQLNQRSQSIRASKWTLLLPKDNSVTHLKMKFLVSCPTDIRCNNFWPFHLACTRATTVVHVTCDTFCHLDRREKWPSVTHCVASSQLTSCNSIRVLIFNSRTFYILSPLSFHGH